MADSAAYPDTPRWVKIFGIIAFIVALLFVALHLTGHRPGHHGTTNGSVAPGKDGPPGTATPSGGGSR